MANRRPIQQAHERAYVQHFLDWFNRAYHTDFKVVSEPNPPEAVIRSSRTTRWVEVSTAFWNEAYARDLYSYATPGETHRPLGGPGYLVVPIKYIWFDKNTVRCMREAWAATPVNDLGCFRSVCIAFPSNNSIKFSRWSIKRPRRQATQS